MEFLIFLLLSPAIFAQNYPVSIKPNDEPFLPIFPQYPYNPKLIKRGIDRNSITQLMPELYATKTDTRDTYTPNYSNNFQKDSYFPSYNIYPKTSVPPPFSPIYGSAPYTAASNPYSNLLSGYTNPYNPSNTYTAPAPYPTGPYPNYFYPPPPYPGYYNQPYPPFLPPPPGPYARPPKPDYDSDEADEKDSGEKKSENKKNKYKDSDRESNGNQFVDGRNYLSDSKDLDGQSSSYKAPNSYNKLDGVDQPKTIYRIINVSGQQNPDYLLSSNQAKVHLENLMRQALTKILAQNVIQQPPVRPIPYPYNAESTKNTQNYINVPNQGIAKTGLTYVINPAVYNKVNTGQTSNLENQPGFVKNLKYPSSPYGQKTVNRVTLERSPGLYLTPLKLDKGPTTTQAPDYGDYDSPHSTSDGNSRNINPNQSQDSVSYSSQNIETAKAPQAFSYHYTSYHPDQTPDQIKTEKEAEEDFEKEKN